MIALLEWGIPESGKRESTVMVQEERVMNLRLLCVRILRSSRTPQVVLHRRLCRGLRRLRKLGVTQAVLPADFAFGQELGRWGVRPVSTLPLRRALAADWVDSLVPEGAGTHVAVSAAALTGEAVRTVTELSLRHRYVYLDVPHGGEELCRSLRREYGVSLMLGAGREQLEGADALVLFDPREDLTPREERTLRLYEESRPLPPISLPPALEAQLPLGAERGQLIAALYTSGAVRPGQMVLPQKSAQIPAKT